MTRVGGRLLGILVLLLAVALSRGGPASAQPVLRAKPERETVRIELAERGWRQGVELEGPFAERTLFFPTLVAARPEWGRVRLAVESQLPGWRRATLLVRVGERSVIARDLLREPSGELVVPLEPDELREPYLRIGLELRGALADDRCVDPRSAGGFVRIGPRSALELGLDRRRLDDVWRLWESLPQRVEIAFEPAHDRAATLHTALLVGLALARSGREVRYRDLDETAPLLATDVAGFVPVAAAAEPRPLQGGEERTVEPSPPRIVVGDPNSLRSRFARLAAGLGRPESDLVVLPEHGDVGVSRLGPEPVLLIRPRAGAALDRLFASGLAPLVSGAESALGLGEPRSGHEAEREEAVPLARLGGELGTRWIVERGGWRLDVPLIRLPPARLPAELVLDLLVPSANAESPTVAAVWLDEELLHAAPLPGGAGPHRLRVRLPKEHPRLVSSVRVELLREARADPCTSRPVGMPAELLASSHLLLTEAPKRPSSFAELAALFDARTAILIESAAVARPAALLATLTEIGRHLFRPGAPGRLRLVELDRPPPVEGPFVLVGGRGWPELEAPLRLDRGRVALLGRSGDPLLEIEPGDDLAIAQLVRLGERSGLWLAATGESPSLWPGDRLDREDLVIGDRHGTRVALRTATDTVPIVDYPEAVSWLDRLAPWRWGVLLAFWAMSTLLLVLILRRRPLEPGS